MNKAQTETYMIPFTLQSRTSQSLQLNGRAGPALRY